MERIKQALEKARQERQIHNGGIPGAQAREPVTEINYSQTRTVTVPDDTLRDNRIITGLNPGAFTDAYKLLRTQILQRLNENNWNVLAITSPGNGEGKTLTAINLAISLAMEIDYTVLLVDANLNHPWMLELFGIPQGKGLSDYLLDDVPLAELLIQPSRIEHLALLPAGRPLENSAEMLNSPKMANLVSDMKARYARRIIIFDLPPVLTSADALSFSPLVDAALLVVEDGKTQKQELERAIELLSGTNLLGTVLNKAPLKKN